MNRFRWLVAGLILIGGIVPISSAAEGGEELLREGMEQAETRAYSAALDAFDAAIQQNPALAEAYYWRARA